MPGTAGTGPVRRACGEPFRRPDAGTLRRGRRRACAPGCAYGPPPTLEGVGKRTAPCASNSPTPFGRIRPARDIRAQRDAVPHWSPTGSASPSPRPRTTTRPACRPILRVFATSEDPPYPRVGPIGGLFGRNLRQRLMRRGSRLVRNCCRDGRPGSPNLPDAEPEAGRADFDGRGGVVPPLHWSGHFAKVQDGAASALEDARAIGAVNGPLLEVEMP